MEVELLTIFNSLLNLRERCDERAHLCSSDLDFLSFACKRAPYSNSQLLQDIWVLYESGEKRNGYFVEFGACDGVSLSNTLLLEKTFEWQGAVAEPARAWHDSLYDNRNCYISDKCIYKTDGLKISFNEASIGELSAPMESVDGDFHARFRRDGSQYQVETTSLVNFLAAARAPKDIDYMSIDVEGGEFDVIESFDFFEYNVGLISVEHNFSENRKKIYDYLTRFGYRRRFKKFSLFDDWYVRPDLVRSRASGI